MKCYFRHFGCKSVGSFGCHTLAVFMVLNARTCCSLIVHEETAPIAVVTECSECDCICRFNVTQSIPIPPVECAELRQNGACGRCETCKIMSAIARTPGLSQLTHVYCAGMIVIQRGYLIPDYCSPILKGLFLATCTANVCDMEAILYNKFGDFMKRHIIAKTLERFKCGVTENPHKPVCPEQAKPRCSDLHTKRSRDDDGSVSECLVEEARVCAPPMHTWDCIRSPTHCKVVRKKSSVDERILPIDARKNTSLSHASWSHGVHQKLVDTQGMRCDVALCCKNC